MRIRCGSRGSKLSIIQTEIVIQALRQAFPDISIETEIIKTTGDRITQKPLYLIKKKGVFEREIDVAVLRGNVDFAVHSLKDVPTTLPPKTAIMAVPERQSPNDVLVSRAGLSLRDLPSGAVVGTSSPRRMAQLLNRRPDLRVMSVRGNVETRVAKLEKGPYDAIVLAEIGLQRLGLQDKITEHLSLEEFTPAPGQGALAVVANEEKRDVVEMLKRINHPPSMAATFAERALAREVAGGCKVPLGAHARVEGGRLILQASVLSPDGKVRIQASGSGDASSPDEVGRRVFRSMLELGVSELLGGKTEA